ncbi:bacteriocin fulvocin C-related protein [Glycomyces paridis]|uniref:Uncharacterized protein n=1 Tax=Glycomyces paridis TaxID=2126555 RepID=A0A4S8PJM6_9ACTN|nr:bacteriocin fulvocin C-related protein [Glycomyces paridis]THV30201.1 hypothetical protein E9998_07470 [Glycomyces paridis]
MSRDTTGTEPRWIMAFDASCGSCRTIAAAVEEACGDKLEVKPLRSDQVEAWRRKAFGAEAPFEPTLLRVRGGRVRAWTGKPMALQLARRLGPRDTIRLLRAFGDREEAARATGNGLSRKGFLRIGTGLGAAAGIVLAGRSPAFAEDVQGREIRDWLEANRGSLPEDFDSIAALPVPYRRAVHHELPPETRTQLWLDHLDRYRQSRRLTAEQVEVIAKAEDLLAVQEVLTLPEAERHAALQDLKADAVAAFGIQESGLLLAVLGAPDAVGAASELCSCSTEDDFCGDESHCRKADCERIEDCGSFWAYLCNGHCHWSG